MGNSHASESHQHPQGIAGTSPRLSRSEAKRIGTKHYFSKPCKRGHTGPRLTSTAQCLECLRDRLRGWRAENPEQDRGRNRKWKNANRDLINSRYRTRYAQDPQRFIEKTKRSYRKNPETAKARSRARHRREHDSSPDYRIAACARVRCWAKKNPDSVKVNARNGKARRKSAKGRHTSTDIKDIFRMQHGRCAYCPKKLTGNYHVDHIQPIVRGGTNDRANLQILCAPCNLSKGGLDPIDYSRRIGLLL